MIPWPYSAEIGKQALNAQGAHVLRLGFLLGGIDSIGRQEKRLAQSAQVPRQFDVGRSQCGADVRHQNDRIGLFQYHARLAKDLRGNQLLFVGKNAPVSTMRTRWPFQVVSPYKAGRG